MDDVQWRFSHGNKVEAKYCPIEIDGDVKYYICPRHEICCTFGCCISSNFHFYQLWYYWLLVILMFLLCFGGTLWYRCWLQESHQPVSAHRRPPSTRVAYHPGHNTVVVQQIWKPQRNGQLRNPTPPPLYSVAQQPAGQPDASCSPNHSSISIPPVYSTAHHGRLNRSPYYQLYGPPPSYESVMTQGDEQVHLTSNSTPAEEQALPSG